MANNAKRIKKIVNSNLDSIYKACQETASKWDKNSIPLDYLEKVINTSKPEKSEDESFEEFRKSYNNLLDTLYSVSLNTAKKMESNSIPLNTLKVYIKTLKTEFNKAIA